MFHCSPVFCLSLIHYMDIFFKQYVFFNVIHCFYLPFLSYSILFSFKHFISVHEMCDHSLDFFAIVQDRTMWFSLFTFFSSDRSYVPLFEEMFLASYS